MKDFVIECEQCTHNWTISIEDILDWLTTPQLKELKEMLKEV